MEGEESPVAFNMAVSFQNDIHCLSECTVWKGRIGRVAADFRKSFVLHVEIYNLSLSLALFLSLLSLAHSVYSGFMRCQFYGTVYIAG